MSRVTLGESLAAEPFTLGLSSGFFGFFAHAGMLAALRGAGLRPSGYAGSSAGALVSALAASGRTDDEIEREFLGLSRADFWDPAPGLGVLRGARFRARLSALLAPTFEACGAPLGLSVFDVATRRTLAVRSGPLPVVVHASCAVPLLFQPVRHEGRALLDGGILDRAGLAAVPEGARVLHHHLASRSPWRRPGSSALRVVAPPSGVVLVLDGLPRSGPFALEVGPHAYRLAREATARALDAEVDAGVVRRCASAPHSG